MTYPKRLIALLVLFCLYCGCSRTLAKEPRPETPPEPPEAIGKNNAYGLFIRSYAYEMTGNQEAAAYGYEKTAEADSEAYLVRYWLARYYFEKNETLKALENMDYLLKRDSVPEYLTFYSVLLVRAGKIQEARSALGSALAKNPDDGRIKEMMASLLEKSGNIDSAIILYKELQQNPEWQDGIEEKLLSLYVQLKDIPRALSTARTLLLKNPNSAAVRLSLFSLSGMVPSPDTLLAIYRDALVQAPDNLNLKKDLAALLIKLDRLGAADSLYGTMMKEHPESVDRKMYGIILASQNKNVQAIAVLAPLLKEKPDADVAFYLGNAYLDNKQYSDAVNAFTISLAQDSTNPSAWMNKGIAYLRMERFDSAQVLFKKLTARFPEDGENDYMLGVAYGSAKNYAAALDAYAVALKKSPDNTEILFSLGAAYERLNDFGNSEQIFLKILAKDSLNTRTLNYLGYMYAERNIHLDTAEKFIRRALEREPKNGAFLDSYGWVLYQMKRYPEADQYLARAVDTQEEDAVIFEHAAMVKQALGDSTGALKFWKKVLELEPQNENAKHAIQSLGGASPHP